LPRHEYKKTRYNRGPGFGPAPSFPGMPAANDFVPSYAGANGARNTVVNGDNSWRMLDWRATADYHFTDDIMMYATANLSPAARESLIRPLDPERVINLESGLRTTWLDGRLGINPTGYYMAWTNRQSSQQQACPNNPECPTGFRIVLANSGTIDVYGLEINVDFAITNKLTDEVYGTCATRFGGGFWDAGGPAARGRHHGPAQLPVLRRQAQMVGLPIPPLPLPAVRLGFAWRSGRRT
jgi:outer membrane receptor protein involved in Fe transport